jgi:acetoin utilization deacetylase AcuC-like enzyme
MKKVGWLDSHDFDLHTNGYGHPECPERLTAVRDAFAQSGVESHLIRTEPRLVDRALLESIHLPAYVAAIERFCSSGGGQLDPDTAAVSESWPAALKAAGGVVDAVQNVLSGTWQRAFCSARPPGHHAAASRAMGFCLFDNVAIGAQAALNSGLTRVAILDWDVHHGNGTQSIFWERGDVFYASWHQYPFYPGTGAACEKGTAGGLGATLNCPLPAGSGDAEYLHAWREQILPALEDYQPELLILSAGFDADARDPLAGLAVTAHGFEMLSREVIEWSDRHCGGRVVSVLEGGYDLTALAEDVTLHVQTLLR